MDEVAGSMPVMLSISAGDGAAPCRGCAANEISAAFPGGGLNVIACTNERTPAYREHDRLEIAFHRNNHGTTVRLGLISVTTRGGRGARKFRA